MTSSSPALLAISPSNGRRIVDVISDVNLAFSNCTIVPSPLSMVYPFFRWSRGAFSLCALDHDSRKEKHAAAERRLPSRFCSRLPQSEASANSTEELMVKQARFVLPRPEGIAHERADRAGAVLPRRGESRILAQGNPLQKLASQLVRPVQGAGRSPVERRLHHDTPAQGRAAFLRAVQQGLRGVARPGGLS